MTDYINIEKGFLTNLIALFGNVIATVANDQAVELSFRKNAALIDAGDF